MRIKLLQDITEPHGIKVSNRPDREAVVFKKDAVIDMSETSAAKYVAAGFGVVVEQPVVTDGTLPTS